MKRQLHCSHSGLTVQDTTTMSFENRPLDEECIYHHRTKNLPLSLPELFIQRPLDFEMIPITYRTINYHSTNFSFVLKDEPFT
jgi:hypothetical protein